MDEILDKLADTLRDADVDPGKARWIVARMHVELDQQDEGDE
jgi:hypothetical protein